jgi:CRP-like cAMP-binding protein
MKDWFRSRAQSADRPVDVDTLIGQGDLQGAEKQLRRRLRHSQSDIYARVKLAEVLMKLRRQREAVDEYLIAAESFARDGFFDKATALLRKLSKMAPSNEQIALKLEALQYAKALEHRRDTIINTLLELDAQGEKRFGASALELRQLWTDLFLSPVIEGMSDDQVTRLFSAMEFVRFDEDQEIAARDQKLDIVLLIGRGSVEARVALKGGVETALRSFSGGDLIGDRALLEHKSWPARYVAAKRTTALKLTREGMAAALTGETDPKGFLDTVRQQRNDHRVVSAVEELEADD